MPKRWIVLHHHVRSKLRHKTASIRDAALRTRYLIVLHADRGMPKMQIAKALGCCRQTVSRVPLSRTGRDGPLGSLRGQRQKVTTQYLSMLKWILQGLSDRQDRRDNHI
jgi:hypothetical protein